MRMNTITEKIKHLITHANRIRSLAERIHQLENLSSQLENIQLNTKRLNKQLNESCAEMRRKVNQINHMIEKYKYIQKKFQDLLCHLSRRCSADDCRAPKDAEELLA